jgi:hypothetical protein
VIEENKIDAEYNTLGKMRGDDKKSLVDKPKGSLAGSRHKCNNPIKMNLK